MFRVVATSLVRCVLVLEANFPMSLLLFVLPLLSLLSVAWGLFIREPTYYDAVGTWFHQVRRCAMSHRAVGRVCLAEDLVDAR
jgi:hypothetical protein